jgi:hypothetical protein
VGVYPPVNASDYAAAVAYVGQRWGSKLAALEVWNEPNNADFWRSSAPASDYARLLRAAYPALKAAAPALTVLGGALLWSDRDFLDALYANGIHGFFDALSIHPYDPPNGATYGPKYTFAQGVPWVHEGMVAHGDGDKQLWLTEFGWPTCPGTLFWWCVSEAEQASRLTDALRTAEAWPYVGAEIIYTLRDPGSAPDNWQHHMGLLRYDYSAKPAWDAFTDALAARPTATGNRAPLARGSNLASSPAIGTVSDKTPPGVKGYGVSNRVFVVGSRSTPTFGFATKNPTNKGGRHETGTTFRYTLSEAATVRLTIARGRSGRQDHKRCVAPTHRLANARKCIRIFVKGTLTRTSHQGPNRIFLSGRIASQALSPGGYQATLTATDAAKNISKPKTITCTIVRR